MLKEGSSLVFFTPYSSPFTSQMVPGIYPMFTQASLGPFTQGTGKRSFQPPLQNANGLWWQKRIPTTLAVYAVWGQPAPSSRGNLQPVKQSCPLSPGTSVRLIYDHCWARVQNNHRKGRLAPGAGGILWAPARCTSHLLGTATVWPTSPNRAGGGPGLVIQLCWLVTVPCL